MDAKLNCDAYASCLCINILRNFECGYIFDVICPFYHSIQADREYKKIKIVYEIYYGRTLNKAPSTRRIDIYVHDVHVCYVFK